MSKKFKKVLSFALSVIMLLGILPINLILMNTESAFLENLGGFLNKALSGINASAISFPSWNNKTAKPTLTYDEETNTLTISADGDLFEYASEDRPWLMYAETCENLVVDYCITRIGAGAFSGFTKLKSVTINAYIDTIKSSTFENCTSLESIVIPNSVTKINGNAFKDCTSLKNVVLPKGLVSLAGFNNCTALESLDVPSSVEVLGGFDGCTSLKRITIPERVKTISSYAFRNCTSLEMFYFPAAIKNIGEYAFQNTSVFGKDLVVPDTVQKIGLGAFSGYHFESITAPFVGSDRTNGENDVDIHNLAYWFGSVEYEDTFEFTYSKTTYYVPESLKSVKLTKYMYEDNFRGMKNIREIIIADTVTNTTYPECFAFGCTNLKNVTTNISTITEISDSAFRACNELESFVVPNGVKTIGVYAFYGCKKLRNVTVPDTVETIGARAFSKCDNLEKFNVPVSIEAIGDSAFEDSLKLSTVTFPKKDFLVYRNAFSGTEFLNNFPSDFIVVGDGVLIDYKGEATEVVVPDTAKRISTAFYNCEKIKKIELPETLLYITRYSFQGCNKLKSLYIPDSVIEISQNAFYGMAEKIELSVPFIGKNRDVKSGKAEAKIMYWFNEKYKELSSFTLRGGVAFTSCAEGFKITTLNIGADVESLMSSCFYKVGINYLNISPDVKFTEIPDMAFANNTIQTLTLPESLKSLKGNAFANSTKLETVEIGKNVEEIDLSVFYNTGVNEFIISDENPYFFSEGPAIYTSEGELYYYNNPEETEVYYIGERVTHISDAYLKSFSNLTEYEVNESNKVYKSSRGILFKNSGKLLYSIPQQYNNEFNVTKDIKEIYELAFYKINMPTLKFIEDIELPAGLLSTAKVENLYFSNLTISLYDLFGGSCELKSVTITNQKDNIPENFAQYFKIETVTINGTAKKLGNNAFGLGEFKQILLPDSIKVIGNNAFNNTKLDSINLGKSLEHIGYAAFYFCNVPEIKLPPTVLTIGDSAFFGTKFTDIILGDKIQSVGEYAFSGSSLKKAVINEKIVDMSDMIFQNCKDLEIVVIGSKVSRIGDLAFQNCNHLNTVVIPNSVKEISEDAFSGANEDVVIFCNPNSYAQSYAEKNNIKYTTLVLDSIPNQTYTSKPIEPEVNAKANNQKLTLNEEYTLDFSDNINVGRAKVVAKGLGDFRHLVATAHFEILSKPVSDVVVTSYDIYYHPKGSEPRLSLYIGENKLVQGVDYEILDNGDSVKNVGTYNVTVKGIGNLTGTYNTTYKILQRSITVSTIKSGDELVVTDSGYTLVEGTDYIVENRVDENGDEKIVVVGIGNYTDEKIYEEKGDFFSNMFTNVITLLLDLLKKLFSIF